MALFSEHYSDFLFARPSFLEGIARLFDFAGALNIYNYSESEREADLKAFMLDWQSVGYDLQSAYEEFDEQLQDVRE